MATSPILPPEVITILTPQQFDDRYEVVFGNNEFERITEGTFRSFKTDLINTFANWNQISANHLRGGTHLQNTLAERDAIQLRRRIIGMSCVVANPVTPAELAAGIVKEAATFQLIRSGGLPYDAYPDLVATVPVNARWVQIGGSLDERVKSYPEFQPEDFIYRAGDAIQYTFPAGHAQAGVSGLYEARRDMADFYNPEPTGLPSDRNWKPFAPLASPTHHQNSDLGTNNDLFEIGMSELVDAPGNYYRGLLINKSEGQGKGFLGARVQNAAGRPVFELVQCKNYVRGAANNLFEPIATAGPTTPSTGASSIMARLDFTYSGPGHVVELPPNTTEVVFVNNEAGWGIHDRNQVLDLDATPQTLTINGGALVGDACYGRILVGATGPELDPTGFWDIARKWSVTAAWKTPASPSAPSA